MYGWLKLGAYCAHRVLFDAILKVPAFKMASLQVCPNPFPQLVPSLHSIDRLLMVSAVGYLSLSTRREEAQ